MVSSVYKLDVSMDDAEELPPPQEQTAPPQPEAKPTQEDFDEMRKRYFQLLQEATALGTNASHEMRDALHEMRVQIFKIIYWFRFNCDAEYNSKYLFHQQGSAMFLDFCESCEKGVITNLTLDYIRRFLEDFIEDSSFNSVFFIPLIPTGGSASPALSSSLIKVPLKRQIIRGRTSSTEQLFNAISNARCSPNTRAETLGCLRSDSTSAGTRARGPKSPPMASTAILSEFAKRDLSVSRRWSQQLCGRGKNRLQSHGDAGAFHRSLNPQIQLLQSMHRESDACLV